MFTVNRSIPVVEIYQCIGSRFLATFMRASTSTLGRIRPKAHQVLHPTFPPTHTSTHSQPATLTPHTGMSQSSSSSSAQSRSRSRSSAGIISFDRLRSPGAFMRRAFSALSGQAVGGTLGGNIGLELIGTPFQSPGNGRYIRHVAHLPTLHEAAVDR